MSNGTFTTSNEFLIQRINVLCANDDTAKLVLSFEPSTGTFVIGRRERKGCVSKTGTANQLVAYLKQVQVYLNREKTHYVARIFDQRIPA